MKVCLVSPEVFHWGVHGGFGYLTWMLGKKLVERGIRVSVVTQRRKGQSEKEELDGVLVYGYPPHSNQLGSLFSRKASIKYYKKVDADIYHSQALSYNTYVAYSSRPESVHALTFQDPYDREEWSRIAKVLPKYGTWRSKIRIEAEIRFLEKVCKKMNHVYSQAEFLIPKTMRLYKLKKEPKFLPNPVSIPKDTFRRADNPTVCFLARWDPQKRVEIFFELARQHPEIDFIAMGKSHNLVKDRELRDVYSKIPNLRLVGFVSELEKQKILGKSWALVNTSIREALPISFLESLASRTPIISGENPDELVSNYGYVVRSDNYISALEWLLESDDWRRKGEEGRKYVEKVHEIEKVVELHVKEYEKILEEKV
jgi:glycosyltransferase involved in cell wall biosynthesis